MLNYLWLGMFVIAAIAAACNGRMAEVSNAFLESSKSAVMNVALPLGGMFVLMLGVMRLVEQSGLIAVLARWFRPLLRRLFPGVPADHPAMGAMMMNMAANLVGAGNAATPFGLRAMTQLDKLNPHRGTATNAMCTFLVLNTSALTLISTTGLMLFKQHGAANPSVIIMPAILATLTGLMVGLVSVKLLERWPHFAVQPSATEPLADADEAQEEAPMEEKAVPSIRLARWKKAVMGVFFLAMAAGYVWAFQRESVNAGNTWEAVLAGINVASNFVLPVFLVAFILYAALAGLKVFEEFIEGAKEGMGTVMRIIPYLVAMIVGIGVLRASGAIDGFAWLLREWLHIPGAFPDLLPMMLMRSLSGSGSSAMLDNILNRFGPDSYEGIAAAIMYGSTETTFYVLAVYFGAVGVRRIRHALLCGLIADAVSMSTAMLLATWLAK